MNDTYAKKECPKCLELRKENRYLFGSYNIREFIFCSEECGNA